MAAVFLDAASLGDDVDFSPLNEVVSPWVCHPATAPEQVLERMRGARIAVTNKVVLDRDILSACETLELIAVVATGTDNVDLAAARELGITVSNVRGYGTASVTQHVFAMILRLATRLDAYHRAAVDGRWAASPHFCLFDYPILELHGKTLGLVGYGELGRGVERLARAFGMQVLVSARPGSDAAPEGRVALDEMLPQIDVLSLHCPLTPQTAGLMDAARIARMKPGSFLINCARGGIVDEQALADALRSGHLGGAGVDVLTEEPPRNGHVLLDPSIPNLIVTPHVAWAARESRGRVMDQLAENIAAFLAGGPIRVVGNVAQSVLDKS